MITLQGTDAHRIRYAPRYFFEKVALVIGTPFTLTLRDARHRVLHTETRSLEPFVAWLRSNHCGSETMLGERSRGRYVGSFPLLEFLPKEPGQYFISLTIAEKASAEHPGSSSTWQILEVELSAAEDVLPLSKTISYPHKRINI